MSSKGRKSVSFRETAWSEWRWEKQYEYWSRYRRNSLGDYEYDYQEEPTPAASSAAQQPYNRSSSNTDTNRYSTRSYGSEEIDTFSSPYTTTSGSQSTSASTYNGKYKGRDPVNTNTVASSYVTTPWSLSAGASTYGQNQSTYYNNTSSSNGYGTQPTYDTTQQSSSTLNEDTPVGYFAQSASTSYSGTPYSPTSAAEFASTNSNPSASIPGYRSSITSSTGPSGYQPEALESMYDVTNSFQKMSVRGKGVSVGVGASRGLANDNYTDSPDPLVAANHQFKSSDAINWRKGVDSRFKFRKPGDFVFGRVFKALSEIYSNGPQADQLGEQRFVVIARKAQYVLALPITTYTDQNPIPVGEEDHHAIIHTGKALRLKSPRACCTPLQVNPDSPRDKLDQNSKLNYGEVYLIEYGVKVCFIGRVHQVSRKVLANDWNRLNYTRPTPLYVQDDR